MDAFFTDDSMIRRVHRERGVGLGGPRALLLMAAHPVAFAGFFAHTTSLDEPYERLRRTGIVMDTITFGSRSRAERMCAHVRSAHATVGGALAHDSGRFPAGTPYRGDDPALLLWILACLVDSCVLAYERYVGTLTREEKDAYWRDYHVVAELFGIPRDELPETWADFEAYMQAMYDSGDLHVSEEAAALAKQIVMDPPLPLAAKPLLELVNQVTVGLLPAEVRRMYGFWWDPVRGLAVRGGAEYVRRVLVPLMPQHMRLVPSARP
jgi:uncharacterized protein (DUF2236 family)